VLSGAGNRHAIEDFKEIEIQCPKQRVRRSCFRIELAPCIEGFLRLTEYLINRLFGIELLIDKFRVPS
jgi:hypothetical protein